MINEFKRCRIERGSRNEERKQAEVRKESAEAAV